MRHCGAIWISALTVLMLIAWPSRGHTQTYLCLPGGEPPTLWSGRYPSVGAVGGFGIPVFDAANTSVNAVTAALMGVQVDNSTKQLQLALYDFIPAGHCWELTPELFARINQVLKADEGIMYLDDVLGDWQTWYPSWSDTVGGLEHEGQGWDWGRGDWWRRMRRWSMGTDGVQETTLATVHEQLKPEQFDAEEGLLAELKAKSEGAVGNLDVSQTGNMITLQGVNEARKLRQMIGAHMNAQNTATGFLLNMEGRKERVAHDWTMRSWQENGSGEVQAYSGQHGYGMFGSTSQQR
jgi:hypothetical protein